MNLRQFFYGLCKYCNQPLGSFEDEKDKIICYQCEGYRRMDLSKALTLYDAKLNELRIQFRNNVKNCDIIHYLKNYVEWGEALVHTDEEDFLTLSSINIKSVGGIDFSRFVFSNFGIKWILEDLLLFNKVTDDYKNEIFLIPLKWLDHFKKKIYLENDLGYLILDKENNERFYFFEKLGFYFNSLHQFGLVNPKTINPDDFKKIKKEILKKEEDANYTKEFVNIHLPLYFVCLSYLQYPNINDRVFSFKDIVYHPIIIDYLGLIINEYKDQRARNQREWSKSNPYFKLLTIDQLKQDIPSINWTRNLENHIITSKFNPMSFPMLINVQNDHLIITPTRLKIALEMMFEQFAHKEISNLLSIIYERAFLKEVIDKLEEISCVIKDPVTSNYWINISDKKSSTFEFDILAFKNNNIFVIEAKSFHPSAFYYLKDAVNRREERVKHFQKQFTEKIKLWLINNLSTHDHEKFIKIKGRSKNLNANKYKKVIINFPRFFNDLKEINIIGLFVTQYKEFFKGYPNIDQIYFDDLQSYIDVLK